MKIIKFEVYGYKGNLDHLMSSIEDEYFRITGTYNKVGRQVRSNENTAYMNISSCDSLSKAQLSGALSNLLPNGVTFIVK